MTSTVNTAQVSVGTTATLIAPANPGRESVTIIQEGSGLVRLGGPGVTALNGVPLPGVPYSSFTIDGDAAIYGIVASGTELVSYLESFR